MSLKSKLPENPTFFIDRSLGRRYVADALKSIGAFVEIHDDHFAQNVNDVHWLSQVGSKGWIILTKDERIRARQTELLAVKNHSVGITFCLPETLQAL